MKEEEKKILSDYRLESADERLHSSKVLLEDGSYKDSIGRSYYAIFTAVRALIALDGKDFSKHSSVISCFQREYVKTGEIDPKYSKYFGKFPK
ncbi:MAG: HEPN domain-containing protein [Clostridiales bacterium]|nr:HEPN domain-containing protein [Clostridiales bacterium]